MSNVEANAMGCAYCGCHYAHYTKDHVFPGSWYPNTTPPEVNRWTVPSCRPCNHNKSKLENYSRRYLAACVGANSPRAKGIWEGAFRGLSPSVARTETDRANRKMAFESFQRKIVPAHRVNAANVAYFSRANLPGNFGLKVDWRNVTQLMILFVRGCHYYLEGEPLPSDARVQCFFPNDYTSIAGLKPIIAKCKLYLLGPGIALKRGHLRTPDSQESLYVFQFWGKLHFFLRSSALITAQNVP